MHARQPRAPIGVDVKLVGGVGVLKRYAVDHVRSAGRAGGQRSTRIGDGYGQRVGVAKRLDELVQARVMQALLEVIPEQRTQLLSHADAVQIPERASNTVR